MPLGAVALSYCHEAPYTPAPWRCSTPVALGVDFDLSKIILVARDSSPNVSLDGDSVLKNIVSSPTALVVVVSVMMCHRGMDHNARSREALMYQIPFSFAPAGVLA